MNDKKYVAALWNDYTKNGCGFKILSKAKLYDHKPTKEDALDDFGEDDEDYKADRLMYFDNVECWCASDDYAELGSPAFYMLTISTEKEMDEILDEIARSMRDKIK